MLLATGRHGQQTTNEDNINSVHGYLPTGVLLIARVTPNESRASPE